MLSKRAIILVIAVMILFFIPMMISIAESNSLKKMIGIHDDQEKVYIDYQAVELDNQAIRHNDQWLVSIELLNQLGLMATWQSDTQQVIVKNNQSEITFTLNDLHALTLNGKVELPIAPKMVKKTAYVPLSTVTEQFAMSASHDDLTHALHIRTKLNDPLATYYVLPELSITANANHNLAFLKSVSLTPEGLTVEANSGELSPIIQRTKNPNLLIVDFPHTFIGSALFDQAEDGLLNISAAHPLTSSNLRVADQGNKQVVRIVVELSQSASFKVEPTSSPSSFHMKIQEPHYTVVIDPGHGGKDPGNIAHSGNYEKEFTLAFSRKLEAALAKYPRINIVATRTDDTFVALEERADIANQLKADVFFSIHSNNYEDSSSRGLETYYTYAYSRELAGQLHDAAIQVTGFRDRAVRYNDYKVTRLTTMPAILMEVGYQSNPVEELEMNKPAFQEKLAAALAEAIATYLDEHEGEQ